MCHYCSIVKIRLFVEKNRLTVTQGSGGSKPKNLCWLTLVGNRGKEFKCRNTSTKNSPASWQ